MNEIVFSVSKEAIHAWDIRTNTLIHSLKATNNSKLAFNKTLISIQQSIINQFNFTPHKHICNDMLTCVDSCADYISAGTTTGRVYLFCGGKLSYLEGHYKAVNCLVFSQDCRYLISGGDDSLIHVWSVSKKEKLKTFSHSLPVTDLYIG
jgi:WD40 repeat protein